MPLELFTVRNTADLSIGIDDSTDAEQRRKTLVRLLSLVRGINIIDNSFKPCNAEIADFTVVAVSRRRARDTNLR